MKCNKWSIVIVFGLILLLADTSVFSSINCFTAKSEKNTSIETELEDCYGIIIPLIHGENLPYTSIQQSITNMINDLLRINIPVFWASSNFSSLTRTISNDSTNIRFFKRGAFIVPFTGNSSTNALIISVATDYELGSEIETYYPVNMFFIMEPLSIDVYPLNNAKCALRYGLTFGYGDVYPYSDILYSSGFLDIQLLLDDEVSQKLNNKDFNILIWPGAMANLMGIASLVKAADVKICRSIRDFVNNGGGYVGSCYGADSASSGSILPIYIIQKYKRDLPTIGWLALTSSSVLTVNCGAFVTVTLVNCSHPVSFGLDKIQESFHIGGPVFTWTTIDQDTQALGILENIQVEWWRNSVYEKMPPQLIEKYLTFVKGKPIWISSNFGEGKIVAFGCHPEFNFPNRQDRVIDNAVLYTTSDKNTTIQFTSPMLFSEINALSTITSNIDLPNYQPIFNEIWNTTNSVNNTCKKIDETLRNMSINIFMRSEEGQDEEGFPSNLHDFYQQWIGTFSKALIKLERVYNLTKNTANISSMVAIWRNKTNTDLHAFKDYCMRLVYNSTVLLRKIENYVGSPVERLQLRTMINAVELLYREGHNLLNQLWSSTVKIYRNIWYIYESEQSISTINPDPISDIPIVGINFLPYKRDIHGENQIIYVDDDASIRRDGSANHPFQHIQDAIDASSDGDSIFVHAGIYYEHLYVGKSIKLIGENKNNTIIDGENRPYHHITITRPNVEITNFTIQNSIDRKCGIVLYTSNNTIRGNIIKNNGIGLGLNPKSSNNTITGNLFIHNILIGMGIDTVTQINNYIENNIFKDNNVGLYVVNTYNTIRNNRFFNDGIFLTVSSDPLVVEISNNTVNGKPLVCYKNLIDFNITDAGEIILSNCSNGVVDHVSLLNTKTGIDVRSSSNINITNCDIMSGIVGISIQSSNDILILHNQIWNNSWAGLWMYESDRNQLLNNFLTNNNGGMFLLSSTSNTIKNNNITNNVIGISSWSSSKANSIVQNNFINNHENAFDKCRNQWDNNYWNDWIGLKNNVLKFLPYHIDGRILLNFDRNPSKSPYTIE
jgi:parallel beta-helix repeat protein